MDVTSSQQTVEVLLKREPGTEDLPLPRYMSEGAAGMDLLAAIEEPLELRPGQRALVPTGLYISLPAGYEAQVRPRSGLAWKHGVTVANAPGTVDSDYRGQVCAILINLSNRTYTIERGERIAQMVIAPVSRASWRQVDELPATSRDIGGFGHTGK